MNRRRAASGERATALTMVALALWGALACPAAADTVVLHFRTPCFQPDTLGPCTPGAFQIPEHLRDAILRDAAGTEFDRHPTNACADDSFVIVWPGDPIQRFVTTTDLAGNESKCREGKALGPWAASVPLPAASGGFRPGTFDLAGRAWQGVRSGVLFSRDSLGRVRKRVIVR